MSLKGKASAKSLEHGNANSDQHGKDKAYFEGLSKDLVVVRIKDPALPTERVFRGSQLGAFVGQDVTEYGVDKALDYWAESLPVVRRRAGEKWNVVEMSTKDKRLAAVLQRDTITLPWYSSDFAARCFTPKDFEAVAKTTIVELEELTGRKVKAWNWHFDTNHFHLDLWSTDVDENPIGEGKKAHVRKSLGKTCYALGPAMAILARKQAGGFDLAVGVVKQLGKCLDRAKKRYFDSEGASAPDNAVLAWDAAVGAAMDTAVNQRALELNPKLFESNVSAQIAKEQKRAGVSDLATENQTLRGLVSDLTKKNTRLEKEIGVLRRDFGALKDQVAVLMKAVGRDRS